MDIASNLQGLDSRVMALVGSETVTGTGCRALEEDGEPIRIQVSKLYKFCSLTFVHYQFELIATREVWKRNTNSYEFVTKPRAVLASI